MARRRRRFDHPGRVWLASVFALALLIWGPSAASAATGCADGTREALVDEATYPEIAGCEGVWEGRVSSPSANSLCSSGWHVCSPAQNLADAPLVKAISYAEATGFGGCFAFNAAHDFGLCLPCNPEDGDQNDLAGMGTECPDLYSSTDMSCLGNGRVDAQNGSDCGFVDDVTTGVICCRTANTPAPAMSPAGLLVALSIVLLAEFATQRRRRSRLG